MKKISLDCVGGLIVLLSCVFCSALVHASTAEASGYLKTQEGPTRPYEGRERESLDQGADWCPATIIPSAPYIDFGTTTGRANDWNPTCAQCCQAEDVIYEFTPSLTTVYRVSLCSSGTFDSILEIRRDGACPGGTQVACSDDVCGFDAQVDLEMIAGTTYYIIVDGYFQSDGPYTLQLIAFGYGAESCPATIIPSLPYTDIGTTLYHADNFSYCSGSPSPDVVYQMTAPATANYTFSLCGSSYDTRIALNTGGPCPGNTQIYCGDNGCTFTLQTQFTTLLWGGLTYYIIVDGASGAAGNYILNVSRDAACDSCEADSCPATIIPSLPYVDAGTTTGKANNFSTIPCGGNNAPDVIYSLSLPESRYLVAWLTNETLPFRHILALRTGSSCPGTNVECNWFGNFGDGASITFMANAFQTYYLVIDNNSNHDGDYVLHVDTLCSVTQQPGDIVECAETPGISHLTTDCSGGCQNSSYGGTAHFITLAEGQTLFGKMFTYYRFQPRPDTDWIQFTLAQACSIRLNVTAEFTWRGLLFPAGCGNTYWHFYTGAACTTMSIIVSGSPFTVLPAGTYNLDFHADQDTLLPAFVDYRLSIDRFPVCGEDGVINAPGTFTSNSCGEGDDCELDINQRAQTEDRLVRVAIPQAGDYTFSLCSSAQPWPSSLVLMSSCCGSGNIIAQSTGGCGNGLAQLTCLTLAAGNYFALVENDDNDGPGQCTNNFTLSVTPCPCPTVDSLIIRKTPGVNNTINLAWSSPVSGVAKIYRCTNPLAPYPLDFVLIATEATAAGPHLSANIAAPNLYARYVVRLDSCGP